jgi:hypothetical protein
LGWGIDRPSTIIRASCAYRQLSHLSPSHQRTNEPITNTKIHDRKWQQILDRSTVHTGLRWLVFAGLMALYALRVFWLNGWFIVTYGLGIYLLNNFIGFLSPQVCLWVGWLNGSVG